MFLKLLWLGKCFFPSTVISDATRFSNAVKIFSSKRGIKGVTDQKSDVVTQMQRAPLRLSHLFKIYKEILANQEFMNGIFAQTWSMAEREALHKKMWKSLTNKGKNISDGAGMYRKTLPGERINF